MTTTTRWFRTRRGRRGILIESLERRSLLASLVPDSFADEIDLTPGNGVVDTASGDITLRAAIMEANALPGPDTITLGPGTYDLSIAGGFEDGGLTGDLDISSELTIQAAGAGTTIVDANGIDRAFHVLPGATVAMSGLTVTGGYVRGDPGSNSGWSGGGITNNGTLVLTDCIVSGNLATAPGKSGDGGGIFNADGTLTLLRVTLSNNSCEDTGGGLRSNGVGAQTTITDSAVSGNVGFSGGGLSNTGGSTLTVVHSTIFGNEAYNNTGGGVRSDGAGSVATVTGSTVSGNTANSGGGLSNTTGSALTVINTVISGNHAIAPTGSGGGGLFNNSSGGLSISRATISDNDTPAGGGGVRSNGAGAVTSIIDSTVSGNTANNGGGLNNTTGSTTTVINTTISGNQATSAGGIYNGANASTINVTNTTMANNIRNFESTPSPGDIDNLTGGIFNIQNSIVASGMGYSGGASVVNSLGNNIFVNSTAFGSGFHASDQLDVNPMLGALASNGGPTQTHALLPGSPAINTANTVAAPALDQRGAPRPSGPQADIGAYEVDTINPTVAAGAFEYQTGQTFSIQFSENVSESLAIGDLVVQPILTGGSLGTAATISQYSYDPQSHTGLFTFPLVLADGNYRATLNPNDVTDIAGNPLDQTLTMDFFVLAGDANRDRIVDVNDLVILANNWMGTGKDFSQADYDYDGDVDARDLGILAINWQQKLDLPVLSIAPLPAVSTANARAPARRPVRLVEQIGLTA